jgi:hypothetical protein
MLLYAGIVGMAPASASQDRVAEWYIFEPKIQIRIYFGKENVGTFNGHLERLTAIWYILL